MRRPSLSVLALGLVTLAASLAPLAPAAAEHRAAPPSSVTLVGSLQDELGCAADWAPDCSASGLSRQDDGTWAFVADVPAGGYEYKVAIDGSWDESYGAGGASGGANLPLVLQHDARLRFTYDDATHRVAVAPAEQPVPTPTAADRALAGTSLRGPLTRENFYFVMADRFDNGDPTNDTGGLVRRPAADRASTRPTRASSTAATSRASPTGSTTSTGSAPPPSG